MASWLKNLYQVRELPMIVAFVKELLEPGNRLLYGCFVELPVRLLYLSSGPDASLLGLIGTALFAIAVAIWIGRMINGAVENPFARVALWIICGVPATVFITTMIWGTMFSAVRERMLMKSSSLYSLRSMRPILMNLAQFCAGFYWIWSSYGPVITYTNGTLTMSFSTTTTKQQNANPGLARPPPFGAAAAPRPR